jgi:hypothetical protein
MTKMLGILAAIAVTLVTGCRASSPVASSSQPAVDWWQDRVFYEIFVRSFADSTSGPLANDGVGDFRGLIERLDYLNDGDPATTSDLGVTGLWLMPINPSPSYHGDTDYFGVNAVRHAGRFRTSWTSATVAGSGDRPGAEPLVVAAPVLRAPCRRSASRLVPVRGRDAVPAVRGRGPAGLAGKERPALLRHLLVGHADLNYRNWP